MEKEKKIQTSFHTEVALRGGATPRPFSPSQTCPLLSNLPPIYPAPAPCLTYRTFQVLQNSLLLDLF